jgi:hypothetical protein
VNPAFRLGTVARVRRAGVLNDFRKFTSGTSSALTHCARTKRLKEDEDMKRTGTLALFLGTSLALLAGVASASLPGSEDIQAPRSSNQDIQAPRSGNDDFQAPRSDNQDIQAPWIESEDIQAPRG